MENYTTRIVEMYERVTSKGVVGPYRSLIGKSNVDMKVGQPGTEIGESHRRFQVYL
jgi:hypothetical protein